VRQRPIRIGVDTGGTFTDLVCLDAAEAGGPTKLRVFKLRSTPSDPSEAILAGIRKLAGDDLRAVDLEITHGSTVATNAVLERKGARVALLTTAGFEDVLRIGRQTRPELYNFMVRRPAPLVPPELTFGIHERLDASGKVLRPIDEAELRIITAKLQDLRIEAVAVCFLHSYANSIHERRVAEALRSAGLRVSASFEVLPEYREYERWSTTVVNAYVAPLMARYLNRLQQGLGTSVLRIMQSNGGSISAARAGNEAVQTILSGPAAGVVGAQAIAAASGATRLITFDMGGTSTDVSLLDGAISTTSESLVGDLPVRLPVLDIHTVGAGGGSVAWIDAGGSLRVGPRSAGADPGPVCFGKGDHLTVTDANLLLGRLDPSYFLGGSMTLDFARTQSIAAEFAGRLGLSTEQFAEGILRIANANMERAVRVVSVQRGFDPRDFALLAFGGAGGLHACDLAASLEMNTVLIPEHSGVLSALGMLLADVVKAYSVSVLRSSDELHWSDLHASLAPLIQRAQDDLSSEGFAPAQQTLSATLAMRYRGQAFEIDVPLHDCFGLVPLADDAQPGTPVNMDSIIMDFHRLHQKLYGYSSPSRATEVVQLRLRSAGRTEKPILSECASCRDCRPPRPEQLSQTIFSGSSLSTPVYHREQLASGMAAEGPALVISGESTNIIPPGWAWRIDGAGTLVATYTARDRGAHAH
jgi:N-methylhydantoinase A/oxoprolinase/acetone carboxylase beta subunit